MTFVLTWIFSGWLSMDHGRLFSSGRAPPADLAAITGTNVRGFHFHHLEITNNAGGGIVLPDAGGTGLVTPDGQTILGARIADINRNLVGGWANPAGLGNNGGPGGIVVGTGIAPLDLAIERVSMNATPGGQQYGVRLRTAQGALNTRINDLSTSGGNVEAGLSIEQTTGPIAANINLLQSSDNDGNGLRLLTGSQRTMRVDGTNITANRNGGDNLQIANNPVAAALPHNPCDFYRWRADRSSTRWSWN